MISVREAEELVLKCSKQAGVTSLFIDHLKSEVLREPLFADRDYPPFHRVAMDGIAISTDAWAQGIRDFSIQGECRAGESRRSLENPHSCLEVMTGAVLPEGANAVIRYEDLQIDNRVARVCGNPRVDQMLNVHTQASDCRKDHQLVGSKVEMLAPHWAIAASIGKQEVQVSKRPSIAIVSTGDELVEVSERPNDHQIRRSNSYALLSSLRLNGFGDTTLHHLDDDPNEILSRMGELLKTHDIVILSGGVSMGKFDFIPKCLSDLKVKKVFHKVRQRPGKPFFFGLTEEGTQIFGLPGNPASALVCFHRYVLPALFHSLGVVPKQPFAVLKEELTFKKKLTLFCPVRIEFSREGQILAYPVKTNGSGDFSSMAKSDGFLELGEQDEVFSEGTCYPFHAWRGPCHL